MFFSVKKSSSTIAELSLTTSTQYQKVSHYCPPLEITYLLSLDNISSSLPLQIFCRSIILKLHKKVLIKIPSTLIFEVTTLVLEYKKLHQL